MYVDRLGQGPDLLLLHGWGLHGGVWAGIAPALAGAYRLTIPDLPGHGRSRAVVPRAWEPAALAEEVQALLPGPAVWLGWSLGAMVALAAAGSVPERVRGLILVGATPRFVRAVDWSCGLEPGVVEGFARDLERDYAATVERFLGLQMGAAGSDRAWRRWLRREWLARGQPSSQALRAGLGLLQRTDLRAALPAIHVPARVIHGRRDRLVPAAAARFLARHLPQGSLALIDGAGHAPFISHPQEFLRHLPAAEHV